MLPIERPHRLERNDYQGLLCCSFTCCIEKRQKFFVTQETFSICESKLLGALEKYHCGAHVYLFMPDHLHLLVEGKSEEADLWKMIVDFKQQTGYWFSKSGTGIRWQKDFYDHILREEENVLKHVAYTLENPIRAGLVQDWKAYPYKGSTLYNIDEIEV